MFDTMGRMASWSQFVVAEPGLALAIRALLHQYGPGLGYLATVRADGGPRVHPVSPVVTDDGLFCFVINSPKRRDLERDGRYALHSFPCDDSDDEAYLTGRAHPVTDLARIDRLARSQRAAPDVDWRLFELSIDMAMVTRGGHVGGGGHPTARRRRSSVEVWIDPGSASRGRPRRDSPTRTRRNAGPVHRASTEGPVCASYG